MEKKIDKQEWKLGKIEICKMGFWNKENKENWKFGDWKKKNYVQ